MSNESILIIDDDITVRNYLEVLLGIEGFYVHCCDSGQSAIALLQTIRFDIILVDYRMPHGNGDEVTKLLRYNYPDMYIIGMSIEDMGEVFYSAGADFFIEKQHLVKELLTLLETRTLTDREK